MNKIAICITTHNRYDTFKHTYNEWKRFMPIDSQLFVVDDASDVPVPEADFRFDSNVGIPRAKNKCLELADKFDHIFLTDDDIYPLVNDWWKPYVSSKEPHLMLNWTHYSDGSPVGDCIEVYHDDEIVAQSHSRGCMLYMTSKVVKQVGGFNVEFGKAMTEHVEYSQRIFNAGLTSFKFADVKNSKSLFYSLDWDKHKEFESSLSGEVRRDGCRVNNMLLNNLKYDDSFHPYKETISNRAVITSYFTCGTDTQRNKTWDANREKIMPLVNSVTTLGEKIIILNDCGWNETVGLATWVNVKSYGNPYFWRWYAEYLYLRDSDLDVAWLVDATDVQMLENPFDKMQPSTLYSGDEDGKIRNNQWMTKQTKTSNIRRAFYNTNAQILNCGLVGGSRKMLMALCRDLWEVYTDTNMVYEVEMPIYNYLLLDKPVVHGAPVNTKFKQYEKDTVGIWFAHK